jgi:serine/threonine protein kinase HipA of HipAB toxin-antitoxin module
MVVHGTQISHTVAVGVKQWRAHAKNFSIRLLPAGRYALTPLYDVMSIWPIEAARTNILFITPSWPWR